MTTIQTERLQILPLTLPQLQLYLKSQAAFAKTIGMVEDELEIDPGFWQESAGDIRNFIFPLFDQHPNDMERITMKIIIFPEEKRIVGGIGGGLPNENGEVQIGYYIDNRYAGRGFATEATGGLVNWIFQFPDVKTVTADTLKDGFASQKVLQRNGFVMTGETAEGNLRWRLDG